MTTKAAEKPAEGQDPPPDPSEGEAEPEGLIEKIEEVVHKIVDPLLNGNGNGSGPPDPLDRPLTARDLEAFAAKQMKAEQGKVKTAKPPSKPPEAPEKPAGEKVPEGVEVPPVTGGRPGWREKLWSS